MTAYQFGTLKYIVNRDVHFTDAAHLSQTTIGSLLQRGWITHRGTLLVLTDSGRAAFDNYRYAAPNYRKIDNGLSERVRTLLGVHAILAKKGAA